MTGTRQHDSQGTSGSPPTWLHRWLPDLKEATSAAIGAALLVWQGIFRSSPNVAVLVVGLACLGVLATGVVQRWLIGKNGAEK